jgi:hypothetical protein
MGPVVVRSTQRRRHSKEITMPFTIRGLPVEQFRPYFRAPSDELARHNIVRVTAGETGFYPCRVLLEDARPGETLLLLNHEYLPVESPYRGRHAIFVNEAASAPRTFVGEVPDILRTRKLISLRAFDGAGMMIDADVVRGADVEATVRRLFEDARAEYLHAHNVARGCFAARIDRN